MPPCARCNTAQLSAAQVRACARASWVAALDDKVFEYAVEDCAIIISLQTQLHEVADRLRSTQATVTQKVLNMYSARQHLWRLLGPELYFNVTIRCLQYDLWIAKEL